MTRIAAPVRTAAVLSVGALLAVVALVGVAATVAELRGTWTWYLGMERAITAATPVALGLLGVGLVSLLGLALVADR